MPPLSHPDSIWTLPKSGKGRQSLWIPYLQSVDRVQPRGKQWRIAYKGGEIVRSAQQIDHLMLYGASGNLPVAFIDALAVAGVVLTLHRRGMPQPYVMLPSRTNDADDVLSQQLTKRADARRATLIARTLVRCRLHGQETLISVTDGALRSLNLARNVTAVRHIEAIHANRYWQKYFAKLGIAENRRTKTGQGVQSALDALSTFLSGIVLRWILFHRLAPTHGFLHEPTSYPSLVYDLIEPFRVWIEIAVSDAFTDGARGDELVKASVEKFKSMLDETVYVPTMHVLARRKSLLHGVVLALRAYLVGDMPRFFVPMEGERNGGRPVKTTFALPGASLVARSRRKAKRP